MSVLNVRLFGYMCMMQKKSPKADENIRSIKSELAEAVDACIEAAGFEFSYNVQRMLLKVCSVGKLHFFLNSWV